LNNLAVHSLPANESTHRVTVMRSRSLYSKSKLEKTWEFTPYSVMVWNSSPLTPYCRRQHLSWYRSLTFSTK